MAKWLVWSSNKQLKIFQWNSLRIRHSPFITCCSKRLRTFLYTGNSSQTTYTFKVKGFKIIRKTLFRQKICILIRDDINYEVLDFKDIVHPSVEFLAIKIFYSNSEFVVVINIYKHPKKLPSLSTILSLINELRDYKNFIILGDFNAHHTVWEGNHWWKEAFSDHRRTSSSSGKTHLFATLFYHGTSASVINLAFPRLAPLYNASIESDTIGSDHFPVVTTIGI